MSWPVDESKLERVRRAMAEQELDAVVARAPDNVVYLTNYWPMKGYDIAVFPREGDPTLIVLEPQLDDATRTAWTSDLREFAGYDPDDPRPPTARAIERCVEVLRADDLRRVGIELSQNTQAVDRMVGEPTTPAQPFFDALAEASGEVVDASGLLAEARAVKTEQEIARIRLANELATRALDHVRERLHTGMRESQVAAMFEEHVHATGVGYEGKVEMARAFTLVWSGDGIRTFTATGARPVKAHEPTLLEIWVSADGYWTDLTKNLCLGRPTPEYERLLEALLEILNEGRAFLVDGASLRELDRLVRARIAEAGYPGQPSHPICHGVGARAHEPPYAHQAGGGTVRDGMVLALEPAAYWDGGGGLRLEDNFLVGPEGAEQLCGFPDDFRLHEVAVK